MKWFKLSLTGLITATVTLSYFYVFDNQQLYQTYRCITGATHWYACYLRQGVEFTTDFYGLRYEGHSRNQVDAYILNYGAWEKPVLYFLRDTMTTVYQNHGIFLDVGANTGQHSVFMSRYATEVHAFEPYEPVLERFRNLVKINNIKNIVIHPVGLGNENKWVPFYKPPETNLGTGSFVPGFGDFNKPYTELQVVVGDDVLKNASVSSVAIIKMDIEGYERFALQGLRRTLSTQRPIVVFELTVNPAKPFGFKSIQELYESFPKNYEFLLFRDIPDGDYTGSYELVDLQGTVRFDVPSQSNAVAYPKEREHQIPRKTPLTSPIQRAFRAAYLKSHN